MEREVEEFRKVVRSKDIKTFSQAALTLRRCMIENDPHRPIYHSTGFVLNSIFCFDFYLEMKSKLILEVKFKTNTIALPGAVR